MRSQVCTVCGVEKLLTAFEHPKARPNPRTQCKECRYAMRNRESERVRHRAYQKQRRKEQPTLVRQVWEKAVYGKCKEELGEQQCRICGETEKLHIDHEHGSGRVRGLLCSKCNLGLGMFRDNPSLLEKAAQYLGEYA